MVVAGIDPNKKADPEHPEANLIETADRVQALLPFLKDSVPYDPVKDFAPVSLIAIEAADLSGLSCCLKRNLPSARGRR